MKVVVAVICILAAIIFTLALISAPNPKPDHYVAFVSSVVLDIVFIISTVMLAKWIDDDD